MENSGRGKGSSSLRIQIANRMRFTKNPWIRSKRNWSRIPLPWEIVRREDDKSVRGSDQVSRYGSMMNAEICTLINYTWKASRSPRFNYGIYICRRRQIQRETRQHGRGYSSCVRERMRLSTSRRERARIAIRFSTNESDR